MGVKVTNNAFGTLSAGINASDTTITLDSGQGARFPTLGAGDYFYGTLVDTSNNIEIIKVTARSTDSMTVTRAQDDTTATAFAIGDRFELRPVAALFEDIIANASVDGITSSATGTAITIDSSDDVTVANDLTVSGIVDAPRVDLKNARNVRMILGGETGALNADDGGVEFHTDTHFSVYENDDTNHRVFHINSNTGIIQMEKQVCFYAYRSSSYALGTGDMEVSINTTLVNRGNHYNTSGNRFTAPVAGAYKFDFHLTCYRDDVTTLNSQDDSMYMTVKKNGVELGRNAGAPASMLNPGVLSRNGVELSTSFSCILELAENDYIEPELGDVSVSLTLSNANFCGFLIG